MIIIRSKIFFERIYNDICNISIRQNFDNRLSRKSKFLIYIYHNRELELRNSQKLNSIRVVTFELDIDFKKNRQKYRVRRKYQLKSILQNFSIYIET